MIFVYGVHAILLTRYICRSHGILLFKKYVNYGTMFQLKSTFSELQGNSNHSNNSVIAAAERRKSELLAVKQNLERDLSMKHQLREQLRRQLVNLLINQKPA
ncbi:unnamed protein product [Cuscuta epithymum]|uniref:Uncharacterized protein n=1 Tax=Cuscuta epithymum TaxID=186058 RepID=A0AAV0CJR6_9ASTE|nr:unnamed protein product [Cuscuta epithymum]